MLFLNFKVLYAFYGNILEYKSNNRDGGKEGLNYLQSELETEMEWGGKMKKYRVDDWGNDEWAERDTDGQWRATRKKQSVLVKLDDDYTRNKVTRGENHYFKEIEGNDININNNLSATLWQ